MSNPNARILIVPKEYGPTEDDTYFGSIGAATQHHVSNLAGLDRMLWESVITFRDGNIFRGEPSNVDTDRDSLGLRGKDLDKLAKEYNLDIDWIKDEFEKEKERRDKSEDALDCGTLIPYSQYEKFPGMAAHIETPTTPQDRFTYLGNCNQSFYDEFPEGHPDTKFINIVLKMLDRDWDDIDEKYGWFVKTKIDESNCKTYVKFYLSELVDTLVNQNNILPDDAKASALISIDKHWKAEYFQAVCKKAAKDPVLGLISYKRKEWDKAVKNGINVQSQVKLLGQLLFKNFREKMTRYHWNKYRELKLRFAPPVIVNEIDINKARPQDIAKALNCSRKKAEDVWHHIHSAMPNDKKGPFQTVSQLRDCGFLTKETFSTSENMEKLVEFIERRFEESIEKKDQRGMSMLADAIVNLQKTKTDKLSDMEWRSAWFYYRMLRQDINKAAQKWRKNEEA